MDEFTACSTSIDCSDGVPDCFGEKFFDDDDEWSVTGQVAPAGSFCEFNDGVD